MREQKDNMSPGRKTQPEHVKQRAVASFQGGERIADIARTAGVSDAAVVKWLKAAGIDYHRRIMPARPPTDMSGAPKVCTVCGVSFPGDALHFYARTRRGKAELTPSCRTCVKAHRQAWCAANREVVKEQNRAAWHRNLEFSRERNRAYRAAATPEQKAQRAENCRRWQAENSDRLIRHRAAHYEANKEAIKAAVEEYRQRTMPRQRANRAAYKARRKGAEGTFTAEDVNAQMRLQAGCCFWCHKNLATTFHIDHLIPLKQGGSNWPDNLVMACVPCNTSRKAKMPDEFREFLRITGRAPASL